MRLVIGLNRHTARFDRASVDKRTGGVVQTFIRTRHEIVSTRGVDAGFLIDIHQVDGIAVLVRTGQVPGTVGASQIGGAAECSLTVLIDLFISIAAFTAADDGHRNGTRNTS